MKKQIKGIKQKQWIRMSPEQKVEHLKSQYSDRYLTPIIRNGIRYDYRVDPDEFMKQRHSINRFYQFSVVHKIYIDKNDLLLSLPTSHWSQGKILLKKIQNLKDLGSKQSNDQYLTLRKIFTNIKILQNDCQQKRLQVIKLMKQQTIPQGISSIQRGKILHLEPDSDLEQLSEFHIFGQQQNIVDGKWKIRRFKKTKNYGCFYYNAVYFDCYEDPNRFKKYFKQKEIQKEKQMEYKNKDNNKEKNKNSVKEQQQISSGRQSKMKEKDIKYQEDIKSLQSLLRSYQNNLSIQLERLQKKHFFLQQKSKQNESQQDLNNNLAEPTQQKLIDNIQIIRKDKQLNVNNCFFLKRGSKVIHNINLDEPPNKPFCIVSQKGYSTNHNSSQKRGLFNYSLSIDPWAQNNTDFFNEQNLTKKSLQSQKDNVPCYIQHPLLKRQNEIMK